MRLAAFTSRAQLTAWRNSLFLIFALCGFGLANWAARVPHVSEVLGLTSAQLGLLLLGIAIGSIAGLTAAGRLISRVGSRRAVLVNLIGSAAGLVLGAVGTATLRSFTVAFVGLLIFGACLGGCDVAMNVSGAANERALGRSVMPIYHGFFSVGTIAGAAGGATAERLQISLPEHLGVVAGLIVILSLLVVRFLPADTEARPGPVDAGAPPLPPRRDRLSLWTDHRTIAIGIIALGMAFAEGSATDWLSYAMVKGHESTATTGALVFGVFVAAMTVGRFVGVALLDRFGRVPVLRASGVLAAIGLLLFIFVPVFAVAIVGVVFWGLGASLGFPVAMSAAADDPRTAAARVSVVATIGYLAFLVGPPAIGFIAGGVGILNALLLVLVLVAAAAIASVAARAPVLGSPAAQPEQQAK